MKVLGFTPTYADAAEKFKKLIPEARGSSGKWFDWAVYAGETTPETVDVLRGHLRHPLGAGIQYLTVWPENRGQHHATLEALRLARALGYEWLLRIDDDVEFKTQRWLKKMLERLHELHRLQKANTETLIARAGVEGPERERMLAHASRHRMVAGPTVKGLRQPPEVKALIELGQPYVVECVELLGGVLRLAPVPLLEGYEPDVTMPVGRGDPQQLAAYLEREQGFLVRFKDIRVGHDTRAIEGAEDAWKAHRRRMGHYWPWVPPEGFTELPSPMKRGEKPKEAK